MEGRAEYTKPKLEKIQIPEKPEDESESKKKFHDLSYEEISEDVKKVISEHLGDVNNLLINYGSSVEELVEEAENKEKDRLSLLNQNARRESHDDLSRIIVEQERRLQDLERLIAVITAFNNLRSGENIEHFVKTSVEQNILEDDPS